MPFDPDSATGKARLAAIHRRESRRPPRVLEHHPDPSPAPAGPRPARIPDATRYGGSRPAPQEAPTVPENDAAPRVRPISDYQAANGGRLLYRAQRGDQKARDELARRAASTSEATAAARAAGYTGGGAA